MDRLLYPQHASVEVEVIPPEPQELALAESGHERGSDERAVERLVSRS